MKVPVTKSTESHPGMVNTSNPENERKMNGSQISTPPLNTSDTPLTESHVGMVNVSNVENEQKLNESKIESNIKLPTSVDNSSTNTGSGETAQNGTNTGSGETAQNGMNTGSGETAQKGTNTGSGETAQNGTSTGRRLLEDNSKGSHDSDSKSTDNSNEDPHVATVKNDEGLEADADSSFELFRESDELGDEYSYDYDDYVDDSMWGEEEWTERVHETVEDYVHIDSHILCTPVSLKLKI